MVTYGDGWDGMEVVSLADHSTGGLTLGAQLLWEPSYKQASVCQPGDACKADLGVYPPYDWHPHVLAGMPKYATYAHVC
jgi:hypothetical protein